MNENIYIKTLEIAGFAPALQAMRLPMKSGDKSDSCLGFLEPDDYHGCNHQGEYDLTYYEKQIRISKKDLKLAQNLVRSGDEQGKVMRGVMVWFEINAPRYFHVELDTYSVGATRLSSESSMHVECKGLGGDELVRAKENLKESHLQKRIWVMSYQTLRRIYFQRKDHRLPLWREVFVPWIETLPLAKELITVNPWYIDEIERLKNRVETLENELYDWEDEGASISGDYMEDEW